MAHFAKLPTDSPLFDSFTETFELRPPVYEFGFSHNGRDGSDPAEKQSFPAELSDSFHNAQAASDNAQGNFPLRDPCAERGGGGNDRLEDLANLPFADASARTVICRGALEHVFEPRRAMSEMHRIIKPGGIIFVCVPGNRSRSGGNHFWHFTPQAMQRLMQSFEATLIGWQGADQQPHTVFAIGCKSPVDSDFTRSVNLFPQQCQKRLDAAAQRIGWIRKLKQAMVAWAFSPGERRRFADHYRVQFAIHMAVDSLSKRQLLESCLGEIKNLSQNR